MRVKVGVVSTSFTGDRFQIMERYVKSEKVDMVCFPEGYFGIRDEPTKAYRVVCISRIRAKSFSVV